MDALPDTVLLSILRYLGYRDLTRFSLTNARISVLCSDPGLWSRYEVKEKKILSDITGFVENRRFKKLQSFTLRAVKTLLLPIAELSLLFSYFHSNHHLRYVKFVNIDISCVPGFPFSRGLSHVASLHLQRTNLTTEQTVALLRVVMMGQQVLDLSNNNLQHVPASVLSGAFSRVKDLDLSLTDLKPNQIKEILMNLPLTERLNLSDLDIKEVNPSLLATVTPNLCALTLNDTQMTDSQKEVLFAALASQEQPVGELIDVSGVSLASLDPTLLLKGLKRTRIVNLQNTWLSQQQLNAIFSSLESCAIEELNLSSNNCSEMRTDELLAAAVSLKRLDLRSSRLPVEAVLEFMDVQGSDDSCKLIISSADVYLTSSFLARLKRSHGVQIVKGDVPDYVDENSCAYGDVLDDVTLETEN